MKGLEFLQNGFSNKQIKFHILNLYHEDNFLKQKYIMLYEIYSAM